MNDIDKKTVKLLEELAEGIRAGEATTLDRSGKQEGNIMSLNLKIDVSED